MRTWTAEGMDWPTMVRQAASRVPDPWVWLRIRCAPEAHVTVAARRVSTKVSRTSPGAVPAGTPVTTVLALADSNVVAAPTWLTVADVVDVSLGTACRPTATRSTAMTPTSAVMTPFRPRLSAGRPCHGSPLRRRGPVSSVPLGWFQPACGHCPGADMSIPFSAIWCAYCATVVFANLTRRCHRRLNSDDLDGT